MTRIFDHTPIAIDALMNSRNSMITPVNIQEFPTIPSRL